MKGASLTHEQRQQQKLALSTTMLQSLQVLQMSQLELYELVNAELNSNPLLEKDEHTEPAIQELAPLSSSALQQDILYPEEYEGNDLLWKPTLRSSGPGSSTADEPISPLQFVSDEPDFYDMLKQQIGCSRLPAELEKAAVYLVDCLDSRGYLSADPEELALTGGFDPFAVMQALYFVQTLTPTGVGARSLEECLTLQLAESSHFNAHTLTLVNKGLRLLAENRMPAIAELLHTDTETAKEICQIVRGLNPIPSRGYSTGERTVQVIPDAIVDNEQGRLRIRMNNSFVPTLMVNQTYVDLLNSQTDEASRQFLKTNLARADALIQNLADREKTLYRVLFCVVQLQPDFFRSGTLLPMTMGEVAEHLDLNISTVSRAVQDKYIVCCRGTVQLRSLFTSGYANTTNATVSVDVIKQQIGKILAAEDPTKPFSDESIRLALENLNIRISRRTVAKYREALGIPTAAMRRR